MGQPPPRTLPPYVTRHPQGYVLRVKVVPGASRAGIVGLYGDRLKVKVTAPPEDGKANAEVERLVREWAGTKRVAITAGFSHREKSLQLHDVPESFDWTVGK
jgi:uncharacterized protein (TIGR00251 family)